MAKNDGGKTEKYIVITELAELNDIKDVAFAKTFESNLSRIFKYNHEDIQMILNERDQNFLKSIRDNLLTTFKAAEKFQSFANKTAIARKKKSKIIQDIDMLGESLSINEKVDNVESIFNKSDLEKQTVLSDPAQMVPQVMELMSDLDAIRLEHDELKNDHEKLKNELETIKSEKDSLATRLAILEVKLGFDNEPTMHDLENVMQSDSLALPSDTDCEVDNNPNIQRKLVAPGPKTTYAYVGCVDSTFTCADMQFHINTYSSVTLKQSDIQEISNKGSNKGFKIAMPQDKMHEIFDIWIEGIKAEPFGQHKPKRSTSNQDKRFQNSYNRGNYVRSHKFRGPTQNVHRPQPGRPWRKPNKPIVPGPKPNQTQSYGYSQHYHRY